MSHALAHVRLALKQPDRLAAFLPGRSQHFHRIAGRRMRRRARQTRAINPRQAANGDKSTNSHCLIWQESLTLRGGMIRATKAQLPVGVTPVWIIQQERERDREGKSEGVIDNIGWQRNAGLGRSNNWWSGGTSLRLGESDPNAAVNRSLPPTPPPRFVPLRVTAAAVYNVLSYGVLPIRALMCCKSSNIRILPCDTSRRSSFRSMAS